MRTERTKATALRAASSIATWVLRAATLCAGVLAMFALVVVVAILMPVMVVATATPALAASAAHGTRKRFYGSEHRVSGAHRFPRPPGSQFVSVEQHTDESGGG